MFSQSLTDLISSPKAGHPSSINRAFNQRERLSLNWSPVFGFKKEGKGTTNVLGVPQKRTQCSFLGCYIFTLLFCKLGQGAFSEFPCDTTSRRPPRGPRHPPTRQAEPQTWTRWSGFLLTAGLDHVGSIDFNFLVEIIWYFPLTFPQKLKTTFCWGGRCSNQVQAL